MFRATNAAHSGERPDEPSDNCAIAKPRPCKCGRGPCRKGQRNCLACNREANRKYRMSLKRPSAAMDFGLQTR